jgi:hypothetical protein
MLAHKLHAKIHKRGYLELRNLPFKEGTQIEIIISKKERKAEKEAENIPPRQRERIDRAILSLAANSRTSWLQKTHA